MVSINYATREVSCKIVYYGPGLSGKTTNLQYVHHKVPSNTTGKLISLATDADRTLYFDFLPINIGTINGFASKFQLYTVPGQVYYNATRKLVLRGVDGLVFVADSQPDKMDENIESLNNLKENLAEYGYKIDEVPIVIQYNKQDLPNVLSPDEMRPMLNPGGHAEFKASATEGFGVFDTLKCILKLVLEKAKARGATPGPEQPASPETPATPQTQAGIESGTPPVPTAPTTSVPQTPLTREPAKPLQPAASDAPTTQRPSQPIHETAPTASRQPQPVAAESQSAVAPGSTNQQPGFNEKPIPSFDDDATGPMPVYRPFPGNTTEDEKRMEDPRFRQVPSAGVGEQTSDASETHISPADRVVDTESSTTTGSPRMAPSLRADRYRKKKKRSFFKRLFGLK
jgi:signal recognition particle receptor subunit beta